MNLFNYGNFPLHSGNQSSFKIDCDFLTDQDLASLAAQVACDIPKFSEVYGVPTGGLRFADAMRPYISISDEGIIYPALIVDDVLSSGKSILEFKAKLDLDREAIGLVIFSRHPRPDNDPKLAGIISIFQASKYVAVNKKCLEHKNSRKNSLGYYHCTICGALTGV